jgi:hypothetical protein
MPEEYQADLTNKLADLEPLSDELYLILRKSFKDEKYILNLNFRKKSIERTIEKDIKEYKGEYAASTQVKDLFAARLIANPDNPDEAEAGYWKSPGVRWEGVLPRCEEYPQSWWEQPSKQPIMVGDRIRK